MGNKTFYIVTDRHGGLQTFKSRKAAKEHCAWLMEGYTEGLRSANDPMPTLHEVKPLVRYSYNKEKRSVVQEEIYS